MGVKMVFILNLLDIIRFFRLLMNGGVRRVFGTFVFLRVIIVFFWTVLIVCDGLIFLVFFLRQYFYSLHRTTAFKTKNGKKEYR